MASCTDTRSPTKSKPRAKAFCKWKKARSTRRSIAWKRGWIKAEWGLSESKRRAKYYELTAAGRDQLKTKAKTWNLLVEAISNVMGTRACAKRAMTSLNSIAVQLSGFDPRSIREVDAEILEELEFHIAPCNGKITFSWACRSAMPKPTH